MKRNMQKSLLIIALTLAMVMVFSGAASAAPANYDLSVKYYKATDIPNVAASLNYITGTINPTAITAANSTDGVVKVINLKNSGDISTNVGVQDILDSNVNTLPPSQWVIWSNAPTNNPEWIQNGVGYTYDPATGLWSLPTVGSSFYPPAGNWASNNYLFIWTTMKTVNADVTSTNTAKVINSISGNPPNIPNAAGTLQASATIIDQAKTTVTVEKDYAAGTFNPVTNPNNQPTPFITTAFYQDKIWAFFTITNVGPSAATGVNLTDTLPAGLVLDTTKSIYYAANLSSNAWTTLPIGSAATVVGNVLTWNVGTVTPTTHFLNLLVPLTVQTSNKLDTNTPANQLLNTATVTQTNRNVNPYATTNGTTWSINSFNGSTHTGLVLQPAPTPLNVPAAADVTITKKFTDLDGNTVTNLIQDTQYLIDIIVTNNGPDAASKVIVTDAISNLFHIDYDGVVSIYNGTEFFSGEDANVNFIGGGLNPHTLSWHVMWPNMTTDTMAPGTYEIKIPVIAPLQGVWGPPNTPVNNSAREQQNTFNPHTGTVFANNMWSISTPVVKANILRAADIAVTKSADKTNLNVGDNVTFTIITTNNGPNRAFVKIMDLLPDGLSLVSITGTDVNGAAYAKSFYNALTGVIDLSRNNTLPMLPGQFSTVKLIAHVDAGATNTIVNEASVYTSKALNPSPNYFYNVTDPDETNNTSNVTLTVGTPPAPLSVVSTTPTQNGNFNTTSPVIITFNHTITKTGNGTVLIKNDTSNKFISAPTVTTSGSQLIINFAKARLAGNFYTVTIPAGLVKDANGQLNAAMTLSFKTV